MPEMRPKIAICSDIPEPAVASTGTPPLIHSRLRCPISHLSSLRQSLLFAELSKLAYEDQVTAARALQSLRFDSVELVESDGAQAYLMTNLTDVVIAFRGTEPDDWNDLREPTSADFGHSPETGYPRKDLERIGERIFTIPKDRKVIPKVRKLYENRMERFTSGKDFDWAMGEFLAYGTLLEEGRWVRMSGQDCERGTFSHRHAVLLVEDTEEEYTPLNHISRGAGRFMIYNSPLSEYGVLGFEYGYSCADPHDLVIWEAQFGDFVNGAQIIIDQFISSSAAKWKRYSGLVMFLPHGYEGQGPEHSSARMERFLNLCAQNNMFVANCTTPANLYHLLRRQLHQEFRLPLVVFTPKSLLRHPRCVSSLEDFAEGTRFQEVFDDADADPKKVKRVLFCTGKIYYELLDRKEADNRDDVAIVRLEQLYPLPIDTLWSIIQKYDQADEHFWVQEEPENMGAWSYLRRTFKLARTRLIAREEGASTATGFAKQHQREQQAIIDWAFAEQKAEKGRKPIHRA